MKVFHIYLLMLFSSVLFLLLSCDNHKAGETGNVDLLKSLSDKKVKSHNKTDQVSESKNEDQAKPVIDDVYKKFVKVTFGSERTLDPATAYDTTSTMRVSNLYETLIVFRGESTQDFAPLLATEVPSIENGGISRDGLRYTFKIRKNVEFHDGSALTPEDVEYSFERGMICDQAGGPQWMMLEALLGYGYTRKDDKIIPGVFKRITEAVKVDGNRVVFKLRRPYPPLLGIIQHSASSIINKKWAIKNGCWDGTLKNAARYNGPDFNEEPLATIENGTGAYKLLNWEPSEKFTFERFDNYWGERPDIKICEVKYIPDWKTRIEMLIDGRADTISVNNDHVPEIENIHGINVYRIPQLSFNALMFCQEIDPVNNLDIGSGALDGNGIPPDFFSDINARKAFAHVINYTKLKEDIANNLIIIPGSPNVKGLPYHKETPKYEFSMTKAKEYLKKAWAGKAWENGISMTITYNTGDTIRKAVAYMIANNLNSLNEKNFIRVKHVEWKDYTVKYRQFRFPVFLIGWGADFPDPHNFVYPFMHSTGAYSKFCGFGTNEIDRLCEEGIQTVNPVERDAVYSKLQDLWYEEIPGVGIYQGILVKPYRKNISGFIPNPMFGDAHEDLKLLKKEI